MVKNDIISGVGKEKKTGKVSSAASLASDNLIDMNARRMLVRPLIGAGLSLIYGTYLDNRNFATSQELMRAGIMAGSIFASDIAGNMLFPHLMIAKSQNYREIENMVFEPLMTGILYTAGKYYLVDSAVREMMDDFIKGAVIDLSAGAGEYVVGSLI